MTDIVSPEARSRMMAGIRGSDTKQELLIRKELHKRGFRYRLHDRKLPGKPDIVFPKYRAVIMLNGCFWHGHDCHMFKWPATRGEFWHKKILGNTKRDEENRRALEKAGWRVLTVWECALKGRMRNSMEYNLDRIVLWILRGEMGLQIFGDIGRKVTS